MSSFISQEPYRQPTRVELPEAHLAAARYESVTLADLDRILGVAFPALEQARAAAGVDELATLFRYHGDPSGVFDLEVASVCATPLPAAVTVGAVLVSPATVPAGWYAVLSHIGSYERLADSWEELSDAVVDEVEGESVHTTIEVYLGDPGSDDPSTLRTDLLVSVGRSPGRAHLG